MKIKDELIGRRFGQLVIEYIYKEKGRIKCRCICDCGNITNVYLNNLKTGKTISCKHRMNEINSKYKNIIGKKYHKLLVIEKTLKRKNGEVVWKCQCDCGEKIEATKKQLDRGYIKCCKNHVNENIIGKKFGELSVVYYDKSLNKLFCKCSCGKNIFVRKSNLINGHTKSCGHLKNSHNLDRVDGAVICLLKSKIPSNNKSGVKGVSITKNGKWQARITLKHKQYFLGFYNKKEDAIRARLNAEENLFKPLLDKYDTKK